MAIGLGALDCQASDKDTCGSTLTTLLHPSFEPPDKRAIAKSIANGRRFFSHCRCLIGNLFVVMSGPTDSALDYKVSDGWCGWLGVKKLHQVSSFPMCASEYSQIRNVGTRVSQPTL